jgi:carotenoid cleavage dioxygenase-like enzyme
MSLGSTEGISSPPLGYLKLDLLTAERQEWFAPEHTYCEEIVVVPKQKESTKAPSEEDDVWLLATMFDAVRSYI